MGVGWEAGGGLKEIRVRAFTPPGHALLLKDLRMTGWAREGFGGLGVLFLDTLSTTAP